jgi:hypothetical protein
MAKDIKLSQLPKLEVSDGMIIPVSYMTKALTYNSGMIVTEDIKKYVITETNNRISTEKLSDGASLIINLPNGEFGKITLGQLKEYLNPIISTDIDEEGTITFPDELVNGEYIMVYEDASNKSLENFASIANITI